MEKKGPAFKPQLLVCYLCGQQFGTSSLSIHVPQCYAKKQAQWDAGDPSTRGKAPKHPDTVNWQSSKGMSVQEQNDQQFSEFTSNLEQCGNCGRKFLADRLVVHQRSCKGGGGSKPVAGGGGRPVSRGDEGTRPSTSNSEKKGPAFKPQLLVCYLCGQQFGSSSLGIHVPQCYAKKQAQWDAGDPSTRGKAPKHPDSVNWQSPKGTSIQEQNDQQFSEFTSNLEQCGNCGRKFLADRLVVHQRSCKGGGGSKPVAGGSKPAEASRPSTSSNSEKKGPAFKPQLLVCYLCGQQFGSSSLGIHVPQCYAKKQAQWDAGDPSTRGKAPKHPDSVNWQSPKGTSIQEQNDQQFSEFTSNLEQCGNCGRKFLADRLVVHQRSCKGGGGSKPVNRDPSPATESRASTSSGAPPPSRGRLGGPPSGGGGGGAGGGDKFNQTAPNAALPPRNGGGSDNIVAKKLPPKLRALQRILFEDCDVNKDGHIDLAELRRMVKSVAGDDCESDVEQLMSTLDLNGDGVIDQEEWARLANATGESIKPLRNRIPAGSPSKSAGIECTKCHAVEHDAKAKFCRDCGNPFKPAPAAGASGNVACPTCDEPVPAGSRFCPTCGNPMSAGQNKGERAAGTINEAVQSVRMEACPSCKALCDPDTNFCDNCGALMGAQDDEEEAQQQAQGGGQRVCRECGEVFDDPDCRFCEECGGPLDDLAPPPKAAADKKWDKLDSTQLPKVRVHSSAPSDSPKPPSSQPSGAGAPRQAPSRAPPPPADDDDDEGFDGPQGGGDDDGDREACDICGRRFLPDVLARHVNFCRKQSSTKRKVFDMTKARMQGTEAAGYIRKVKTESSSSAASGPPKKDWKAESLAFRRAMQEARKVDQVLKAGGTAKDLPPPTYSENAHYKPCPHCGRKFAPDVAERHIPKCATTVNKPKAPPRRR